MVLYPEAADLPDNFQDPKERPPHYFRNRALAVCLIGATLFFGCQTWMILCQMAGATAPIPGK